MVKKTQQLLLLGLLACYLPVNTWAASVIPSTVLPERQTPTPPPGDMNLKETPPVFQEKERKAPKIDEAATKVKFPLNEVIFEGLTLYKPKDLSPFYEKMIGKEITLADLQILAESIEKYFVSEGYILVRVIIPPQEIDKRGVVKLQVIEGYVSEIVIEGDAERVMNAIQPLLVPIVESIPLKVDVMERAILLVNDLPGIKSKAVLTPSPETQGASTLVLLVDREMFEGSVTWDNRGTKFVGPNQFSTSLSLNNIFQHVAKTTFDGKVTSNTRELKSYSLRHTVPMFDNGSTIEGSATRNRVKPGNDLSSLKVNGTSSSVAFVYRYPIIRTRRMNLNFSTTYDYLNSETDLSKVRFTLDRIESARMGISFDALDSWRGINLITANASHGLNMLSGKEQQPSLRSRSDGRKDYAKVDASYTRLQYLPANFSFYLAFSGQYAFNALLSAEEFGYGGPEFGSAYDSSEIIGDHGFAGKAELRYNSPNRGQLFRTTQYYASYDAGAVWDKHDRTSAGKDSASSAATGIRLGLADRVNASLDIAKPLSRKVSAYDDKTVRWFFSITVDLDP